MKSINPKTMAILRDIEDKALYATGSLSQSNAAMQEEKLIKKSTSNLGVGETLPCILDIRRRDFLTTIEGQTLASRILATLHLSLLTHSKDMLYRDALIVTSQSALILEGKKHFIIQVSTKEWSERCDEQMVILDRDSKLCGISHNVWDARLDFLEEYLNRDFEFIQNKTLRQLKIQKHYPGEKYV